MVSKIKIVLLFWNIMINKCYIYKPMLSVYFNIWIYLIKIIFKTSIYNISKFVQFICIFWFWQCSCKLSRASVLSPYFKRRKLRSESLKNLSTVKMHRNKSRCKFLSKLLSLDPLSWLFLNSLTAENTQYEYTNVC